LNAKIKCYLNSGKNIKGIDQLEDLDVDGKIILEWIVGKVWTGCIWFRIGTSGGLL
jgi:hypothetical protein